MPVAPVVQFEHAPMLHLRYHCASLCAVPGPPRGSMAFIDAAESMYPQRVGLPTTTQFRAWLPAIQAHLEEKGHVIRIGEPDRRGPPTGLLLRGAYPTPTRAGRELDR